MNPFNIFRYVPLFALRMLALAFAWLMMRRLDMKVHNTIRKNLLVVYPQLDNRQRQNLHKAIVKNQCLTSVESVKSWAMPPEWSIKQIHTVHNQEVLMAALANPKGMLALVPHLGTWEIMNPWLNQYGAPTIMYKPVKGKVSNEFVLQGRERLNATLVPTDAQGVKAIFKTLLSGGFSIVLPDHVPQPSGGVVLPFFDMPTMSSTLAPKLASKTNCALVGLTCIRREDGKGFDIHCHKLDEPALYDKDLAKSTLALNKVLEKMIMPLSEHYIWSYKRFKYVPEVENLYALTDKQVVEIAGRFKEEIIIQNSDTP